jgi:hypothetical protein
MKKILVPLVMVWFCGYIAFGQVQRFAGSGQSRPASQDSHNEHQQDIDIAPDVRAWTIDQRLGVVDSVEVDSIPANFPFQDPVSRYSIANAYNGTLGSPLQSKIFFDRTRKSDFLFAAPYDAYSWSPSDFRFYNTKTPYSNITYLSSYPGEESEDHTKALFSLNVNRKLNLTGMFDYIYARGRYDNQSDKGVVAALYGSYFGKHYSASGIIAYQKFDNYENGGLANDRYITHPSDYSGYTSATMPVNLAGALSSYKQLMLFYTHRYSLGFTKEIPVKKDSVREEFIPVTSFIHTLKATYDAKRFRESSVDTVFFANTNINRTAHTDTAAVMTVRNTFAIRLEEKFNRLLHFGLTAYLENDIRRYTSLSAGDTLLHYKWEQNTRIGGVLSKHEGRIYKYDFQGNIVVVGPRMGDTELKGNVGGYFSIGKDSVTIGARAGIESQSASYFLEHYYSNHFKWNNNFEKEFRTYIGGDLAVPTRHIKLGLQIANCKNLIYTDKNALPAQYNGSVQVIAADASIDFHFGKFSLENKGVYQVSSNQAILPLPALSLFNNFYFTTALAKVLRVQLGVAVQYHTAYYAPSYMPATGLFYNQSDTRIGNYPLASAYVNCHLKRTRFYVEYYHANQSFMPDKNYFSMPHYPLDPTTVKIGISWNFYD